MNIVIDGVTYKAAYPVGATLTHEGGLNQATVQIRHISKLDAFTPFTDVHFLGEWWCIAHDNVVKERYLGKATHNITLVEITKRLERVICGAKTFTHPLHVSHYGVPITPTYISRSWVVYSAGNVGGNEESAEDRIVSKDDMNFIPSASGEHEGADNYQKLEVLNCYEKSFTIPNVTACRAGGWTSYMSLLNSSISVSTSLYGEYETLEAGDIFSQTGVFYIKFEYESSEPNSVDGVLMSTTYRIDKTIYRVYISPIPLERKPLTISGVTKQLLRIIEPTRDLGKRLYFYSGRDTYIYGHIAIRTDDIEAPEFSFADGATLKENLDQIAKVLHAKTMMYKNDITNDYTVFFTPLTTNEKAIIKGTLIGDQTAFSAEKYAGKIHTSVQNMSFSSAAEGSIAEPCGEYADSEGRYPMRTPRCAESAARIDENTGEIETLMPIKRIISLKMSYGGDVVDITQSIREKSVYQGLSSYDSDQTKVYYLYYSVGEKNIKGLFEKAQTAGYAALQRYAITNIYNNAKKTNYDSLGGYQDLLFFVEYEPYINLHLVNSRVDGKGSEISYIANQAACEVDKDSLADFARGTIEQMASDSPKKTYLMRSLDMVPQVGAMYDDHNYISEVSFENYPYFVKCTISISEHYNRLGQRVEVPNAVRHYEVDINNVLERNIIYIDVCRISFARSDAEDDSLLSDAGKNKLFEHIREDVHQMDREKNYTASLAQISTFTCASTDTSNAIPIASLFLPVASFGFGNSLVFTVPFKDNFSAGSRAIVTGNSFNLQEYAQYGDTYGCAELMKFSLYNGVKMRSSTVEKNYGREWPLFSEKINDIRGADLGQTYASTDGDKPYIYIHKDSREKITFTYQLLFQSDCGIIVGNDFAANSPLVKNYSEKTSPNARIYFYGTGDGTNRILHPITGTTETNAPSDYLVKINGEHGMRLLDAVPKHDSWAIIKNGKFMLGSNAPFPADGKLYFNYSHK